MNGQWGKVPDAAADVLPDLFAAKVYIAMCAKAGQDRYVWIGNRTLGERFGVAHTTVSRAIRRLENAGLVERDGRKVTNRQTGRWVTRYYLPQLCVVRPARTEPPEMPPPAVRPERTGAPPEMTPPPGRLADPPVRLEGPVVHDHTRSRSDSDLWFRPIDQSAATEHEDQSDQEERRQRRGHVVEATPETKVVRAEVREELRSLGDGIGSDNGHCSARPARPPSHRISRPPPFPHPDELKPARSREEQLAYLESLDSTPEELAESERRREERLRRKPQ